MFKPLSKDNISGIVDLIAADLNKRLKDREISVSLTKEAKEFVVKNAYDPAFGARPLKRYIQKNIETMSARLMLEDKVKPKSVIEFYVENGGLEAKVKQ